jgi:hypothetical protein
MGHGEMTFHSVKRNVPSVINSNGRRYYGRAERLVVLALMLIGGGLLLLVAPGLGKDRTPKTKTVTGVVFDADENAVVGAMVELKDLQTGKVLDGYSQQGGHYQFEELRFDHDYTVVAAYKGSSSEVRQISSIDTRWFPVFNLVIPKAKTNP